MSSHVNATAQGIPAAADAAPLKRAPTLYAIIFFKLIKGVLFFAFGLVLYFQATHDLPGEWEDLLKQPTVEHVFERLRIHPENKFFQQISSQGLGHRHAALFSLSPGRRSRPPLSRPLGRLADHRGIGLFRPDRNVRVSQKVFALHAAGDDRQHPYRLVSLRLPRHALSSPSGLSADGL